MCQVHLSRRQLYPAQLSHHLLTAPTSGDIRIFLSFSGGISPSERLVASECRPRTPVVSESRPKTKAAAENRPGTGLRQDLARQRERCLDLAGRPLRCPKPARQRRGRSKPAWKPSRRLVPARQLGPSAHYQRYVKCEIARIFMRRARKHPAASAGACRIFIKPASETLFSPYARLTHFRSSAAYDASCRAHRQGPWPRVGSCLRRRAGLSPAAPRTAHRARRHVPRTNALSPAQKERGIPWQLRLLRAPRRTS